MLYYSAEKQLDEMKATAISMQLLCRKYVTTPEVSNSTQIMESNEFYLSSTIFYPRRPHLTTASTPWYRWWFANSRFKEIDRYGDSVLPICPPTLPRNNHLTVLLWNFGYFLPCMWKIPYITYVTLRECFQIENCNAVNLQHVDEKFS